MASSALGLYQTKPGTALGGRSRAQLPDNSVPSNMNTDNQHQQQQQQLQQRQLEPNHATELEKRDRSILSQVHLSHTASDVSSIPDYDIFSHTEAEVRRSKKEKELYAKKQAAAMLVEGGGGEDLGQIQSMESDDLFAGLDEEQLERLIANPDTPALVQAKKNKIPATSVVSGSQHKSVTSIQHKSSNKSDTTPMLSNITPKIFTSDAANNYYNAMKREGSKISDGNAIGKVSGSMSKAESKAAIKAEKAASKAEKAATKAEAKAAKKAEKAANKKTSKKFLSGVVKSSKKNKPTKSIEEMVDEALAVAKTPEEVAYYLLAQDDSEIDKKTLYVAIIDKLMEQHQQNGNNNSNKSSQQQKETIPNIEELNKSAVAAPARTIPPVSSFEHSTSGFLSTTSSITQNTGCCNEAPPTPATASIITEKRGVPEAEEDMPPKNGGTAPSGFSNEYDPPIVEYPSPTITRKDIDMEYPKGNEDGDEEYDDGKIAMPEKLKLQTIDGCNDVEESHNRTKNSDGSSAASRNPSVEKGTVKSESRDDCSKTTIRSSAKLTDASSSNTEEEDEQGPNVKESTEHEIGSYNNIAIDAVAGGESRMHTSDQKEGEDQPQQQSAADANDDLSENQMRRKTQESGMEHATQVNNAPHSNTKESPFKPLRGVRSVSPGLLQMQKRQQQEQKSVNSNIIHDDGSKKSGGSNKSGIGHANNVNDALSRTGSFNVNSKNNNSKDSSQKSLRGVRSMSPSLFKKKKFVESQPSTDEQQQLKVTLSANEKDTVAAQMALINRNKLRAVRSMSPSVFGKKQMIAEEDLAVDGSKSCDSKSKDDSTAASTTASSSCSLSASSAVMLSRTAIAAGASGPAHDGERRQHPRDTTEAGSVAVLSSRAVAAGANAAGVVDPAADSGEPIEKTDEASIRGMRRTNPVGIRATSPVGMASKIRRLSSFTSKDDPASLATPVIENKSLTKNGTEKEDAMECISSLQSRNAGGGSKGSSYSKYSRSTLSKESKLSETTTKKNGALLPPRIPSRLPVSDAVATSATTPSPRKQRQELQKIVTSSDDDGSVECSVMTPTSDENEEGNNKMLQLTVDGNVTVTNLAADGVESVWRRKSLLIAKSMASPSSTSAVVATASSADESVEASISNKGNNNNKLETTVEIQKPTIINRLKPLPVPKKEPKKKKETQGKKEEAEKKEHYKKGKLAVAKEKYQKHQPRSPTPEGKTKHVQVKNAVEGIPSLDADDSTINSSESRRSKRERFEKIKKCRNKTGEDTPDTPLVNTKNSKSIKGTMEKIDETNCNNGGAKKKKDGKKKKKKKKKKGEKAKGHELTKTSSSSKSPSPKKCNILEETKKRVALLSVHEENNTKENEKERLRLLEPMASPGTIATKTESKKADRDPVSPGVKSIKTEMRSAVSPGSMSIKTEIRNIQKMDTESPGVLTNFFQDESTKAEEPSKEEHQHEPGEPEQRQTTPKTCPPKVFIAQSESSGGVARHPVKHVKFDPDNKSNDDASQSVSLPPEIKDGKKIKIWEEDASFAEGSHEDGNGGNRTRKYCATQRGFFPENCFSCGSGDKQDTVDDVNSLFDETDDAAQERQFQERRLFACGMIPHPAQLKRDISTDARGAYREIKGGIRSSIRSLFGACDITQDGGVDFLRNNMTNANDQYFEKRHVPKSYQGPASSPNNESPQAKKMTSIIGGETPQAPKKTTVQSIEEKQKKQAIKGAQKQRMYMEKLKEVSLKHL